MWKSILQKTLHGYLATKFNCIHTELDVITMDRRLAILVIAIPVAVATFVTLAFTVAPTPIYANQKGAVVTCSEYIQEHLQASGWDDAHIKAFIEKNCH